MKKYWTIFQISWQNEFVYRLNFILWRLRNVLRFLMTYFLWQGVFLATTSAFGYSQSQMLTYIFTVLIVQALVLSSPSSDNIGGEIGSGDLSNYLVKPLGYLKYWFTRDMASKLLNIIFSLSELTLLWFIFRPHLIFPTTLESFLGLAMSASCAVIIYYLLNVSTRFVAFWTPENTWGLSFLILVFLETLAGGIFPLNILPAWLYTTLQLTPFPYLIYFPISILSGKIVGWELVRILGQSFAWVVGMYLLAKFVWRKGLVVYQANGR